MERGGMLSGCQRSVSSRWQYVRSVYLLLVGVDMCSGCLMD